MDKKPIVFMNKKIDYTLLFLIGMDIISILISFDDSNHSPKIPYFVILIFIFIIPFIKNLFLPSCKAAEIIDNKFLIYKYDHIKGNFVKHTINLDEVTRYYIGRYGGKNGADQLAIDVNKKVYRLKSRLIFRKNEKFMNYPVRRIKWALDNYYKDKENFSINVPQKTFAKNEIIKWLSNEKKLEKKSLCIKHVNCFIYNDDMYYIFKFKRDIFDEWMFCVCGGFKDKLNNYDGHILSDFTKYDKISITKDAKRLIEKRINNINKY